MPDRAATASSLLLLHAARRFWLIGAQQFDTHAHTQTSVSITAHSHHEHGLSLGEGIDDRLQATGLVRCMQAPVNVRLQGHVACSSGVPRYLAFAFSMRDSSLARRSARSRFSRFRTAICASFSWRRSRKDSIMSAVVARSVTLR